MCERHPHIEVTHYCQLHEVLVCPECAYGGDHGKHMDKHVKELSADEIERTVTKVKESLEDGVKGIQEMLERIGKYQKREERLAPIEVIKLLS